MQGNMSVVERDIARYERALERAKTLGFFKYIETIEEVIRGMKKIVLLDMSFLSKEGTNETTQSRS